MQADKIVVLKLITGEELVATLTNENHDSISVENVLMITIKLDEQTGKIGFGFLPYSPLSEDKKTFQKSHIVHVAEPKDMLANGYKSVTGRVIAPSKELIIG